MDESPRKVEHTKATDPERIWLSPSCDPERTWCQDAVFEVCDCGAGPVAYLRADLATPADPAASADPAAPRAEENPTDRLAFRGSLRDRWEAMDAAALREEVFRFFRAQGLMQAHLYEQIDALEKRIGEQRKEITRLHEANYRVSVKLAEAIEATDAPRSGSETKESSVKVEHHEV